MTSREGRASVGADLPVTAAGRRALEVRQKPDLAGERLVERVQEEYGLRLADLTPLELGGDLASAVYRATSAGGRA